MKIKVKLTGLDCPNCARNLQNEINKLEGVKNANIEFVKNSLTFEADNAERALEKIKNLTKQLEPQAVITSKETTNRKAFVLDLVLLVLGISIGVFIFFCPLNVYVYWSLYVLACVMLGYKTYIG